MNNVMEVRMYVKDDSCKPILEKWQPESKDQACKFYEIHCAT